MKKLQAILCLTLFLTGCVSHSEESAEEAQDFATLYRGNCAACHGPDGRNGAAPPLHNGIYQSIATPEILQAVIANGRPGTPMPAFAKSSGGILNDEQIRALVSGMQARWKEVQVNAPTPLYVASEPGNAEQGKAAFAKRCQSCHGEKGTAGSVVDASYLALVSDQLLRSTIIAGRGKTACPDWQHAVGGPMSVEEIGDLVAWLASQRGVPGETL